MTRAELIERPYRTCLGDVLVDERTGERWIVVAITRAEDIKRDWSKVDSRSIETQSTFSTGRRRGPMPPGM